MRNVDENPDPSFYTFPISSFRRLSEGFSHFQIWDTWRNRISIEADLKLEEPLIFFLSEKLIYKSVNISQHLTLCRKTVVTQHERQHVCCLSGCSLSLQSSPTTGYFSFLNNINRTNQMTTDFRTEYGKIREGTKSNLWSSRLVIFEAQNLLLLWQIIIIYMTCLTSLCASVTFMISRKFSNQNHKVGCSC